MIKFIAFNLHFLVALWHYRKQDSISEDHAIELATTAATKTFKHAKKVFKEQGLG